MKNTLPDRQYRSTAASDELVDFPLERADDRRVSNDPLDVIYPDRAATRRATEWDLSADAMRAAAASEWRRRVFRLSLVGVALAGALFAVPLLQRGNLSSMFDWSGSAPAPDDSAPAVTPPPAEPTLPPVIAEAPPVAAPATQPESAAPPVAIPQTPTDSTSAPQVARDQAPPSSNKPPPIDASASSRAVETAKQTARVDAPNQPPQGQRTSLTSRREDSPRVPPRPPESQARPTAPAQTTPAASASTAATAPAQPTSTPPAQATPPAQTTPSSPAPTAAAPPSQAAPPQPVQTASAPPAQTAASTASPSADANRGGSSDSNRVALPSDVNRVRLPSDVNRVVLPRRDGTAPSSDTTARAPAASSAPSPAPTPSPAAPSPSASPAAPSPSAAPSTPSAAPPVPAATTSAPPRPAAAPPVTPPSNAAAPAAASSAAAAPRPAAPLVDRSRETDTRAIEGTLARYRNAFNALNANAAAEVWPNVDKRTLTRAFEQLKEQRIAFDGCQTDVRETRAEAICTGLTRYVPRVGGRLQVDRRQWTFNLIKVRDDWVIQSVEAR